MLDTRKMLSDVNAEMDRLGRIRDLLMVENGTTANGTVAAIPAQPNEVKAPVDKVPAKRTLSPEGRERIIAAIKKRWRNAKKEGKSMGGLPLKAAAAKKAAKKAPKKAAKKTGRQPGTPAAPAVATPV